MAKSKKNTRKTSSQRRSESRRASPTRSVWCLRDEDIERALHTGANPRELEELFGATAYAELRQLATDANRRSRRSGHTVLILPGIMGSKLGEKTTVMGLLPRDDVYWVDPLDLMLGRIARLDLALNRPIKPLGVFLIAYAKLKFRLLAQGINAQFFPYDWRLSIRRLGEQLAQKIHELGVPVSIVAHSMGGLVSRAAISRGAKPKQLIQLGSPNFGSYAPLLALRGVDSSVKKLAALDLAHDQTSLIARVLRGFPGLLELLPSRPGDPGSEFFDRQRWPTDEKKKNVDQIPAPTDALLRDASRIQAHLAPVNGPVPCTLIAGLNQRTVTGAKFDEATDQLSFEYTAAGDGTVPLRFAEVPGLRTYYVEELHGQLANNRTVAEAVIDLLDHGETDKLPKTRPAIRRSGVDLISERTLRAQDPFADLTPELPEDARRSKSGVRQHLPAAALRNVLSDYVAASVVADARTQPTQITTDSGSVVADDARWNRMIVGRGYQHRLEIQIANCSITQVSARAYVLGLFREVTPTGAANYIDNALDGAITEFTRRRMFSGGVGEVFIVPANRSRLRADMVLFAGLGSFDQFNDDVQRIIAENVIRTFVRTRVEDFATVMFGGGSGGDVGLILRNLLVGFIRGKLDADTDQHFRRVTLCELDKARYAEIRSELFRLSGTPLFEDIEVTFTELPVPTPDLDPEDFRATRGVPERGLDPVYLIVRRETETQDTIEFGAALLGAGAKAAILTASRSLKKSELDRQLAVTAHERFSFDQAEQLGRFLGSGILPESICQVLTKHADRHLVVVHDGPASRLPWETLHVGAWGPALGTREKSVGGMSRRYMAANLSVAKYLEHRQQGAKVRLLVVANPTEDLPGAEREGKAIVQLFAQRSDAHVTLLEGSQATHRALLNELASGHYDLVHYAGHAYFDPELPARSGLLCYDEVALTGADLSTLGNLPKLVFFNACESGRLRRRGRSKSAPSKHQNARAKLPKEVLRRERVAPAEAFLRGGVANFIGTYWPVNDGAAEIFSNTFYAALLQAEPIGDAMLAARKAVHAKRMADWCDYIHYGDYRFRIK